MTESSSFTGTVQTGLGLATKIMTSGDWQNRIAKITSLKIVPGTLNVKVDPLPSQKNATYFLETHPDLLKRQRKGIWLWRVLIAGLYEGFMFQADEPNYPENFLEIVSDRQLRQELHLRDGDDISFVVLPFIANA
jgi:CTP-dependent riboflavin kinase